MELRRLVTGLLESPASGPEDTLDDLAEELRTSAGLSDEQAKAAASIVAVWLRHAEKRRRIIAAVSASTASVVVRS